MGSSAGSNRSTEQSCADLPLETEHVADGRSERTTDSNICPVDHSRTTTRTQFSLSHSDKTQTPC